MKKSLLILLVAFLSTIPSNVYSQSGVACGFDEAEFMTDSMQIVQNKAAFAAIVNKFRADNPERQYISNPTYEGSDIAFASNNCFTANFVIPVVVHVVRYANDFNVGAGTNIDSTQIFNAIEQLNKAFRNDAGAALPSVNTGIQFCLAKRDHNNSPISGIYRYSSDVLTGFRKTTDMAALIQLGQLPPERYINIYVVHDIRYPDGSLSDIQGTASFPNNPYQAVIVRYDWFGAYTSPLGIINAASLGLVLPHEIGHYLGLKHPFTDICTGIDDKTCKTEGDLCCDVPAVSGLQSSCSNPYNTCNMENYSGYDPLDQKENYMDYTVESCKTTFTPDQTSLMVATLNSYRSNLASAPNVNAAQLTCCFLSPRFGGINFGCKDKDTIKFEAIKYSDNPKYKWTMYKRSGSIYVVYKTKTDSTTNKWNVFASDTGLYDVELTITSGTSRISLRQRLFATVVDCGPVLNDTRGNWYFGLFGGLNFRTNSITRDLQPYFNRLPPKNQIYSEIGTISQSNSHGHLLFYGGVDSIAIPTKKSNTKFRIYNKNYLEMTGSPILGDNRVSQPALILPFANDTNKYYVFSLLLPDALRTGIYPSLYYSIVNMSLNSGLGQVQAKDSIVLDSTYSPPDATCGFLTAIPRCDNRGYWVIFGAELYNGNTTRLIIFSADSSGVKYHASRTLPTGIHRDAVAKFSPVGNLLSIDRHLFLFDRSNASITLLHTDNSPKLKYSLGNSFSPNSKNLYRVEWYDLKSSPSNPDKDYKFNLYQLNPLSSSSVLSKKFITQVQYHKQIQMGPDNKLYMSAIAQNFVSNISNPNTIHTATTPVNFNNIGVLLSQNGIGGSSELGLPNFVDAKPEVSVSPGFDYIVKSCGTVKFIPDKCCAESYKWVFGDNDSSTVKFATHTYSDTGNFTVILRNPGNNYSKTIHIGKGNIKARIIGDSTICDTLSLHEYSPAIYPDVTYQWKQTGAKFFIDEDILCTAKWNKNAQLKLIVTDGVTGCKDSTKVNITRLTVPSNNTIPNGPLYLCSAIGNASITGSSATVNGGGPFTYQWYYKSNLTGKWVLITGANGKDYTPNNLPYSTNLVRSVNQGSCFSYSNALHVNALYNENTIKLISDICIAGQSFTVAGSLPNVTGVVKTYSWEKSTDGTNWTTYTGATGKDLVKGSFVGNQIKLHRIVTFTGYCSVISPLIDIIPEVYIKLQPKTMHVCPGGTAQYTYIIIDNRKDKDINHLYTLVHRKNWVASSNKYTEWYGMGGTFNFYSNSSSHQDSFKFGISIPGCGDFSTNSVTMVIDTSHTTISSHPRNRTVNDIDTVVLHADVIGGNPNVYFQWQKKMGNGGYVSMYNTPDIKYSDTLTTKKDLIVKLDNYCAADYYRLAAYGACPTYSNAALVAMNKKSDLWMKDSHKDTGAEPNKFVAKWNDPSQRTVDIFMSPDLINCTDNGTCTKHEQPEFKRNSPNYIKYKIRNKGTQYSKPANLFLYWTKASTGEIWQTSWTENSKNWFYNSDSDKVYLLGNYINQKVSGEPITVRVPIVIPSIAPKDSFEGSYPWYPPNPKSYYVITDTSKKYDTKLAVCILGRIQYCDNYPHKMAFDELLNRAVDTNVINNNNIVTHNMWVYDVVLNNYIGPKTRGWTRIEQPIRDINNMPPVLPRPLRLKVYAHDPTYFDHGKVYATMDDKLLEAWAAGGYMGDGFILEGINVIRITSPIANFENIISDSALIGNLGLEFLRIDSTITSTNEWIFSLSQNGQLLNEYDGGTLFQVRLNCVPPLNKRNLDNTDQSNYIIYPNPANTVLNIYIITSAHSAHKMELMDISGKVILHDTYNFKLEGKYTKHLDISHLATGTYFIRLSGNNKTVVKMVSVMR